MPRGYDVSREQERGATRNPVGFPARAGHLLPASEKKEFFVYTNLDIVATTQRLITINENANRIYFLIQNLGAVNVYVSFGAPQAGALLLPNSSYELDQRCPNNALYIYTLAGTAPCVIVEGVKAS